MPIPSVVGNPLALGLGDALQGYLQGKGTAYQRQIGMMQAQGDFLKNQAMADYYTGRNQTNQNVADTRANGQMGAAMFRMNGLIYSVDQRTGLASVLAHDDGRTLPNDVTPFIQRAQNDRGMVDPWGNFVPGISPGSGAYGGSIGPPEGNYPTAPDQPQGSSQSGRPSIPPVQSYSIKPLTGGIGADGFGFPPWIPTTQPGGISQPQLLQSPTTQPSVQSSSGSVPPAPVGLGNALRTQPMGQGMVPISNGVTYDPNSGTYFKDGFPTLTLR